MVSIPGFHDDTESIEIYAYVSKEFIDIMEIRSKQRDKQYRN